ncbi:MAG TPA: cytochrome P450 [Acidimicrobiales bacterium]|nr:cytochrome P450 [Acidimicrobiales bacterium]
MVADQRVDPSEDGGGPPDLSGLSGLEGIDPRDAAFFGREDYYEVLARLRAEDPVHACAPGFWAVTRYEDIRNLSRDPAHFCSGQGALANDPIRTAAAPMAARSILHMDPPEHAVFRKLVNRQFTPRALAGLEESIRKSVASLLDAAEPGGEIDFVAELAAPFPLSVIADLLGIDEADRTDFRRWSDAAIESPDLPPEETMAALGELSGFIMEHIRAKRDRPGQDLVSLLVGSEVDGQPLSKEELFMFLLTLLVAGNETTRTLVSGSAIVLSEYPDQRAALAADPSLLPGALEECLRWVTPVHAFCRTATEDAVVADTKVRSGDYLCMLYASANRDESVFGSDAAEFDVRRETVPVHLAFGFGEHVCLGASLARIETRVFFEELLAHFPDYSVTGPVERVLSTTVAGIRSLPAVLAP